MLTMWMSEVDFLRFALKFLNELFTPVTAQANASGSRLVPQRIASRRRQPNRTECRRTGIMEWKEVD